MKSATITSESHTNVMNLESLLFGGNKKKDQGVHIENFQGLYDETRRYEGCEGVRVLGLSDLRCFMVGTKWWLKEGGHDKGSYEDVDGDADVLFHGYKDKGNADPFLTQSWGLTGELNSA